MTKPFGYFSLSQGNKLIKDITETFGDGASDMSEDDTLWVLARLSHGLWISSSGDQPPSAEAEEIVSRLYELSRDEQIALLRCLAQ